MELLYGTFLYTKIDKFKVVYHFKSNISESAKVELKENFLCQTFNI